MATLTTVRTALTADDEAQDISDVNPDRLRFLLSNNSEDYTVYVAFGEDAEATDEFLKIGPGRTLEERPTDRDGVTQQTISVICAMGETADVVLVEWERA